MTDDLDNVWLGLSTEAPRHRPSASHRLTALRRNYLDSALSAIRQDRAVRVSTYVLALPGTDIDATHALLDEFARARGWHRHRQRFVEQPAAGPTPVAVRPEFSQACRHAGAGFVDGILTTNRAAMPDSDDLYEHHLHWLHDRCAFIAYAQPAPHRPPAERPDRSGSAAQQVQTPVFQTGIRYSNQPIG
ncbi:hypothetical protein ABZV52_29785 [Streptomyces sp. NPDC004735]|uniref:hypothetical protein n=1 Tax=Streptomyces sp. NPDC004735 TaxID=3156654 RepID=UPI0033BB28CD